MNQNYSDASGLEPRSSVPHIRPVDPYLISLLCIVPKVFDVAKHVTPSILADKVVQVGSKAHVDDRRLVVPPLLDWEALEEHETFTIKKLIACGFKHPREFREQRLLLLPYQNIVQQESLAD